MFREFHNHYPSYQLALSFLFLEKYKVFLLVLRRDTKKLLCGNLKIDGIIYFSKLRQALARAQATYKQHAEGLVVANDRLAKWLNARCLSYYSIKFTLQKKKFFVLIFYS